MRPYLTMFPLVALTMGLFALTATLLADKGLQFSDYKNWVSVLLSLVSLLSNAAMAFYFAKSVKKRRRRENVRDMGE